MNPKKHGIAHPNFWCWLALSALVLQLQCKKDDKPAGEESAQGEESLTECQTAMKAWTQIWTATEEKTGLSGLTPGINLSDVWGAAPNDVYAVGFQGVILHYDGKAWTPMTSGTTADLEGLWGYVLKDDLGAIVKKDLFAVGASGTVLRSDGTTWTALKSLLDPDPAHPNPQPITDAFHDVWGVAAAAVDAEPAVMAVGASGLISRLDSKTGEMREMRQAVQFTDSTGKTRTEYQRWSPERLGGVFGTAANAFTAVGNSGTILQWNGTGWSRKTLTGFSTSMDGIWGRESADTRIVGLDGKVLKRKGSDAWEEVDLQLPPVYLRAWWSFDQPKCGQPEPETTTPTDVHWEFYVGWEGALMLRKGELSCPWEGMPSSRFEGIWGAPPRAEADRTNVNGEVQCDPVDVWITGVNGTLLRFSNPKGH